MHEGDRAVVAWVIGPQWQGHGYATEAARQMFALLVTRGVLRVEAYIEPGHASSERVAVRLGMTATGQLDSDGEQLWFATPTR